METFIDYLTDYEPLHHNPKHKMSQLIRKFKSANSEAFHCFSAMLQSWIDDEINIPHLVCTIPSCNQNKINQITKLAQQLCTKSKLLIDGSTCITKRYTTPSLCQTRWKNLEMFTKSFEINPMVKGKHILLLDDVTTTGMSFRTLETLLLKAGATSVTCLALAQTIKVKSYKNQ